MVLYVLVAVAVALVAGAFGGGELVCEWRRKHAYHRGMKPIPPLAQPCLLHFCNVQAH